MNLNSAVLVLYFDNELVLSGRLSSINILKTSVLFGFHAVGFLHFFPLFPIIICERHLYNFQVQNYIRILRVFKTLASCLAENVFNIKIKVAFPRKFTFVRIKIVL